MRQFALISSFIALFVIFHGLSAQIGGSFSNFSPMVALFFCGAAFWRHSKLLLPVALVTWVVIAPLTAVIKGYAVTPGNILVPLLAFAAVVAIGFLLRSKKPMQILGGALGSGIAFHLITNLWSFFSSPLYEKTWNGLAQALWTIPNGLQVPTSFFLRQTCASTVLFTALFMAAAYAPYFRANASKGTLSAAPTNS